MDVDVMENAAEVFNREGLNVPYLPSRFRDDMRMVRPGVFGTREEKSDLLNIDWYIEEVVSKEVSPYIMMGIVPSENEMIIHYYLVERSIAIFLQLGLGIKGDNREYRRVKIEGALRGAEMISNKVNEAENLGLVRKGKRLVIIESDIIGMGYIWIEGLPGSLAQSDWDTRPPVMLRALMSIPKQDS